MTAPSRGIVFGATGETYRRLSRRAARTIREVMPDIEIDIFTEKPLDDAVFDRVHLLETVNPRPKMEALRRSRFDLTLFLDSDVIMLHPVDDIFDCLEVADIVGVHHQFGSAPVSMLTVRRKVPTAFRQINGGVLGIRKSPETEALMRRWGEDFVALNQSSDQPLLRELLFESTLRLIVLPQEYNMMFQPFVRVSNSMMMAPRLLHVAGLHEAPEHWATPDRPFRVAEIVNPPVLERLRALAQTDRTLGARPTARAFAGAQLQRHPKLYQLFRRLRRLFG